MKSFALLPKLTFLQVVTALSAVNSVVLLVLHQDFSSYIEGIALLVTLGFALLAAIEVFVHLVLEQKTKLVPPTSLTAIQTDLADLRAAYAADSPALTALVAQTAAGIHTVVASLPPEAKVRATKALKAVGMEPVTVKAPAAAVTTAPVTDTKIIVAGTV